MENNNFKENENNTINSKENENNTIKEIFRQSFENLHLNEKLYYKGFMLILLNKIYEKLKLKASEISFDNYSHYTERMSQYFKDLPNLALLYNETQSTKNQKSVIKKELKRYHYDYLNYKELKIESIKTESGRPVFVYYQTLCLEILLFRNMKSYEKFEITITEDFIKQNISNSIAFKLDSTIILFQRKKYTFISNFEEYKVSNSNIKNKIVLTGVAKKTCTDFIIISLLDNKNDEYILVFPLIIKMDKNLTPIMNMLMYTKRFNISNPKTIIPRRLLENDIISHFYKENERLPPILKEIILNVNPKYIILNNRYQKWTNEFIEEDKTRYKQEFVYVTQSENTMRFIVLNNDNENSIPYAVVYIPENDNRKYGLSTELEIEIIFQLNIIEFDVYKDINKQVLLEIRTRKQQAKEIYKNKIEFNAIIDKPKETLYINVKYDLNKKSCMFALKFIDMHMDKEKRRKQKEEKEDELNLKEKELNLKERELNLKERELNLNEREEELKIKKKQLEIEDKLIEKMKKELKDRKEKLLN